jgi:hypothetical protein
VSYAGPGRTISGRAVRLPDRYHVRNGGCRAPEARGVRAGRSRAICAINRTALCLARRARAVPLHPRRRRGSPRPGSAVLDHQLLHQGGGRSGLRVVAPGLDLSGLSTPDVVTAWVAFTPATEANGAMEYIPGSHRLDQIPHRDTFAKHNLLTRARRSWSGSTFPAADHHPASRRDVAAPRAPRSRLPAEPVERLAHRLCHPLYPD